MLAHAFDDCGFGRVKIQTDMLNTRSQAAIAKLGAVREGVLRRHQARADGTFRDTVVFSILRDEWPAVRGRPGTKAGRSQITSAGSSVIRSPPPSLRADRPAAVAWSAALNALRWASGARTRARSRVPAGNPGSRPNSNGSVPAGESSPSWSPGTGSSPSSSGTGPSTSASGGSCSRSSASIIAACVPSIAAIATAGGKPSSRRAASSTCGVPRGIPADQRLHGGQRGLGRDHTCPPRRCGRTSAAAAHPPPQRLLPRPQIRPAQQQPAVQQQGGAVTGGRDRLRTRRGDDDDRTVRHVRSAGRTGGIQDRYPGEGTADLLGGAAGADGGRPDPVAAAGAAAEVAPR